jgi:NADPH2:quinone reductase
MKAIQIKSTGGADVLQLAELSAPKPKPHEAIVKITASGVNFIDIYQREGRYPVPLPFVPGQEAAGIVTETGSEVQRVKSGDHVAYAGTMGGYAEYAAVPADRLVQVPKGVDDQQAAAAMLQGMTAHYLSHSSYPLKPGETALVHAAAGGVGQLLVQMCHRIGARVIATVSTEEKAALARQAGADEVILYTRQDFEAESKRLTNNRGVDVVYDSVGKATFDKSLNVLRPRGYLVLFGGSSGAVPPFDLIQLSQKGSLFITRPTLTHYTATRAELEQRAGDLFTWIKSGQLKLRIDRFYPLTEAQQAHRDLEGRKTAGKLLLTP